MYNDMKDYKKQSMISLIAGYTLGVGFILLILFGRSNLTEPVLEPVAVIDANITEPQIIVQEKIVYIDNPVRGEYFDHLAGTPDRHYIDDSVSGVYVDTHKNGSRYISNKLVNIDDEVSLHTGNTHSRIHDGYVDQTTLTRDRLYRDGVDHDNISLKDDIDYGLLDRRLLEKDNRLERHDDNIQDRDLSKRGDDLSKLTLDRDDDSDELEIEVSDFDLQHKPGGTGYGTGKGGELYAYNYPSRGVGAGIGAGSVGAGAGSSAGLGAGIGQGLADGKTVPTLGGVGTYTPPGATGEGAPTAGGVGGLVGGAGAGGAAGLITGMVKDVLGIGPGAVGKVGGGRGKYNYDHLPKDGALHIMMHVDGSGSILNTRKQLDIMKNTLLKTALLPYYNNDEDLFNRRVTIVDGNGERTLQFFTEAAKKDNVLAVVFQDEAQPAYHLPTFNKKPLDEYSKDLGKLKASLNGYGGVYRGVMFQVDRGKTFAKSFKEFVESAWRGQGYLESSNLKKYYRDNNTQHIKNMDGIVFSDEYHADDAGDPQYYLDLIFNASKKIGLNLDIYGGGLTDGRYNKKTD